MNIDYGTEWKKNFDSLEEKRIEALKYLGSKHILKGGKYSKNFKVLVEKEKKSC